MNHTLNQIIVIARRDFMAVVATPTFLLFLLAPFFMLGISVAIWRGVSRQIFSQQTPDDRNRQPRR